MEEFGLREDAHNPGNMSKHNESSVDMARRPFGIVSLGLGIAERSILVVISPWVLLVRRDIITKFVLGTLAPKTCKLLERMSVAILRVLCKPCHKSRFAMPEVAI
jgi:hypothetical protein